MCISACHYHLEDASGLVKSPGYPSFYPNLVNCSWLIVVESGNHITLTTKRFQLEASYNCESDALYIYDGPDEKSKLLNKPYCGYKGPSISSSKNYMFLRFITDSMDNGIGFLIQYESVKSKLLILKLILNLFHSSLRRFYWRLQRYYRWDGNRADKRINF